MNRDTNDNDAQRAAELAGKVLDEIERVVIGKRPVLELVLLALLSDGTVRACTISEA